VLNRILPKTKKSNFTFDFFSFVGKTPNKIGATRIKSKSPEINQSFLLSGRQDSNLRPPGPKPGALPACATSRVIPTKCPAYCGTTSRFHLGCKYTGIQFKIYRFYSLKRKPSGTKASEGKAERVGFDPPRRNSMTPIHNYIKTCGESGIRTHGTV
jgi:hypothetical protein